MRTQTQPCLLCHNSVTVTTEGPYSAGDSSAVTTFGVNSWQRVRTHGETSPTHCGLLGDTLLLLLSVSTKSLVIGNYLSCFLPRCRNRGKEVKCCIPREKILASSLLQWFALITKHAWYPHFPFWGRSSSGASEVTKGEQGEYLRLPESVQTHCFLSSIRWLSVHLKE